MRRQYLSNMPPVKQQGFALFIVLIMMIVVAVLVVAAAQSYNTEMRISSNDADRKLAMSVAEAALRQGESEIADLEDPSFTADCTDGLCSPANAQAATVSGTRQGTVNLAAGGTVPVWQPKSCGEDTCLESKGKTYGATGSGVSKAARYVIEFISHQNNVTVYRVTARAWGKNANTMVTVQSYVESSGN
ncbi:hypothetical protein PL75_03865 [Neisseria arctica]|uniref:Pilus assembly protein PilX n=1 Tax=Neisseria arctica TaxID=1470200 RepID=A0A0J0YTB7_9NEIS|nr:PilX N-terminal domain-containing pilus assembly protein [Neisseria arctica]KLT73357.1 hypothetical protein PL75_03865 [Neisseria arctica]UOO87377.1 PilX N-terminal domain-containing pilus assembly protein [Neisseria arctica]